MGNNFNPNKKKTTDFFSSTKLIVWSFGGQSTIPPLCSSLHHWVSEVHVGIHFLHNQSFLLYIKIFLRKGHQDDKQID